MSSRHRCASPRSPPAAGAFSGLFGVGGGTIIVPLLVLWLGYGQKEATGTSLAAIIVIGALAAGAQALYGNVDLWLGLAIGVPAASGCSPARRCSSASPSARSPARSWCCWSARPRC